MPETAYGKSVMLNPEKEFIIDAVSHAYNLAPDNYADVASAAPISDLTYLIGGMGSPDPQYNVPRKCYISDWAPDFAVLRDDCLHAEGGARQDRSSIRRDRSFSPA